MNTPWLMLASLVPMMIGTTPDANEESPIVSLCSGGVITIPLGDSDENSEHDQPCHTKACHAGNCRKQALGEKSVNPED